MLTQTTQNGKAIGYVYDIPGRTRTVTYPGGRVITESTDPRSRLGQIDDVGSPPPIVRYTYDFGNRVICRIYRNGTEACYTYNANNWVVDLTHSKGPFLLAGFGHAYDKEGNKQYLQQQNANLNCQQDHDPGCSEAYQYDNIYRLIDYKVGNLVGSTVPVPTTQTQYELDPVGNWNKKIWDNVPQFRTHNAVNELTAINGVLLSYDDNGNLIEDKRYSYAYDPENRLTAVTRNSDGKLVGQYRYDTLSRRIAKVADPEIGPPNPQETRYFYDDARIIEEQNPTGATLATYVYGNYIDEVLTMDRNGQTYYYHQNALWSVIAITNSAANVVERYAYGAYRCPTITDGAGNPVAENAWGTPHSAIGNPWMFTGRQLDKETGLYFYWARYYDCGKGRFLQRDPLGYVEGINLYAYVNGNPVNLIDPFGNQELEEDLIWKYYLIQSSLLLQALPPLLNKELMFLNYNLADTIVEQMNKNPISVPIKAGLSEQVKIKGEISALLKEVEYERGRLDVCGCSLGGKLTFNEKLYKNFTLSQTLGFDVKTQQFFSEAQADISYPLKIGGGLSFTPSLKLPYYPKPDVKLEAEVEWKVPKNLYLLSDPLKGSKLTEQVTYECGEKEFQFEFKFSPKVSPSILSHFLIYYRLENRELGGILFLGVLAWSGSG